MSTVIPDHQPASLRLTYVLLAGILMLALALRMVIAFARPASNATGAFVLEPITVLAVWWLAKRFFGDRVAIPAALFLAVHPDAGVQGHAVVLSVDWILLLLTLIGAWVVWRLSRRAALLLFALPALHSLLVATDADMGWARILVTPVLALFAAVGVNGLAARLFPARRGMAVVLLSILVSLPGVWTSLRQGGLDAATIYGAAWQPVLPQRCACPDASALPQPAASRSFRSHAIQASE